MIGKTLSHYRVTAALGAGGMGEVYRATDTNLNREVAIKVLPQEVAQDEERLARFRREAQLLASLNHPNIAAIYGLEEAAGKPFLALELVDGEDLKERLERGAIPVDEALEIARQIAEGLEAAHEEGIVHRDLKPANVKLTPDGKVKVLDFGLAKAWAGDGTGGSSSASMSQSPTLAHTGTAAGLILGTAAYMSPEQARGKAVSKRADVWAFGVLLWEMLTGRSLFTGETVTDVIAAVMTKEPDLMALPAGTPRAVRRLIVRCLRRDPRARVPDIGVARLDLQEVLSGTGTEEAAEPAEGAPSEIDRQRQMRERWAWAAALALIAGIAAVLAVLYFSGEAPEAPPAAHFVLDLPDDLDLRSAGAASFPAPAVSPDGRQVAFVAHATGGSPQVWIRSLDMPGARPLPGTEDGRLPFWSPDGRSLGFAAGEDLKKLTLDSGTVRRIGSRPSGAFWGGTWNEEGTIVFCSGDRLYALHETGGEARLLTSPDQSQGETRHFWPQFLPDGRHFLFAVAGDRDPSRGVFLTSLDAPDAKRRLVPAVYRAVHASGHLLSRSEGTLFAQPFDTGRLEMAGEPLPVAENVAAHSLYQAGFFGASSGGVLAYVEVEESNLRLIWLARSGERLETVGGPGSYGQVALSPDGRRLALEIMGEEGIDLWVMDVSRGVTSRVTSAPGSETDPVWSPDSQELIYHANGNAFRQGLGSGAPAVPLSDAGPLPWPESWSSDGETLLYARSNDAIWALPLAGGGPPELVLDTGFQLDEPHLSPDGRWLAYISDESGNWEVYIGPFGRPGERMRVSVDGGGQPKWRKDGRELFYVAFPGHKLMAVAVREEAGHVEVGLPTELFEIPVVQREQVDDYAVSPDGQRFLVKKRVEGTRHQKVHVVTNWTSLLR